MPTPDPIAFSIGGFEIRWYGILVALAIGLAVFLTCRRSPRHNLTPDRMLDVLVWAIPAGLVGARVYYALFRWSYYSAHTSEILHIRGGGLAIHGGLLFSFLAAYLVCRHKKIDFWDALDLTIPTVALAQAIGRWGNYFNSEAHGGPTDLPWAITVEGVKVHPTFLYESLWCLFLFFLLTRVNAGRTFVGETACLYGILYSLERFFVEALRTDSLMIGPFKQAQVLSLCVIFLSLLLFAYFRKTRQLDYESYMAGGDPAYQKDKAGHSIHKSVRMPKGA